MTVSARALLGLPLSLLLAAGLAGCGRDAGRRQYQQPVACPVDGVRWTGPATPLPDDFVPTVAWRCTFVPYPMAHRPPATAPPGRTGDLPSPSVSASVSARPDPGWEWRTVQRAEGSLDALATALRTPPPARGGDAICTLIMIPPVTVVVADAAGHVVVPAVPINACGHPVAEVRAAIEALNWEITKTNGVGPGPSPS
ncbi:hypothetical protein [Mangrovihabitans endophyticus]|uniref:DUF3558 domain-containing protein n=1 Tax=Mangrovihabitans endophyticus TaxID=1751298 RepID=A0A8J3C1C5_9ACTN|nr:hypothetical protein [Mangrovihabitans endophyticus]GGK95793.1 hypothetical protein GCM10012284_32430 [Mangrovihabitans endophyticus]